MHLGFTGGLDLLQRVGVVLSRRVIEENRGFFDGAVELGAQVRRQRMPEVLVGDERVSEPAVQRDGQVLLHLVEPLRQYVGWHVVFAIDDASLQRLVDGRKRQALRQRSKLARPPIKTLSSL